MKVAVIGGIAFAVGLAGGTGIGMRGGPAPTAADSAKVHADSSATLPDSAEGGHVAPTVEPTSPEVTDSSTHAAAVTAPEAAPADTTFDAKRLAESLGKLSATDAAPLLARFSDDEIIATLKQLGMTRAGPFVAKLPEPRSTRLSRRLLLELGSGGHE